LRPARRQLAILFRAATMAISVFELFSIGIGPSSSHTVGPMRAANRFVTGLGDDGLLPQVAAINAHLYGSLGATGKGHGSDKAIMLGLEGETPEQVDPDTVASRMDSIAEKHRLTLPGGGVIDFDPGTALFFDRKEALPFHPNGLRMTALDAQGGVLRERTYYSVGGGFVVDEEAAGSDRVQPDTTELPYAFTTAAALLDLCASHGMSISSLMWANELAWRDERTIRNGLLEIWAVMQACVERGFRQSGTLPGGMHVIRRAPDMYARLAGMGNGKGGDPLAIIDWVSLFALAVSEENAAGGRVVTAPTNGAAGIIPAVMHYCDRFCEGFDGDAAVNFLLTAAAIALLYKENASISGADVGCQGEIGVACSMAAGALAEFMGGTPQQVENAAEIGMEHNLGLTCDPVGGLVQVPCIERNAMGSVKAIQAARLALQGDGKHFVSLDKVIRTMRETGADMQSKYKETSRGGLAVNVIEC